MNTIVWLIEIEGRKRKLMVDNRHDARIFWLLGCGVASQVRAFYKEIRSYPAGKPEQYPNNGKPCELDKALGKVFINDGERIDKWRETYSRYIK